MRFSFANRADEIRDFRDFLRNRDQDGGDRICLVSGPSGIGKSRLVDEVAFSSHGNVHAVRVRVRQSDYRCGESGFFLRMSAVSVSDSCKKELWGTTLESYAHAQGGVAVLKGLFGAAAKKVEKLASGDADISTDLMSAWTNSASTLKDLLGEPSAPALKFAFDYLSKALDNVNCVLVIENSQRMDSQSLHYIHSLLDRIPVLQAVYEYTTSQDTVSPSTKPYENYDNLLAACLADEFGVCEIPVSPLNFDTLAAKNFQNDDRQFVESLRAELHKSNGNVRDVERLHDVTGKRAKNLGSTSVEAAIVGYTSRQKLVLWIIALSRRSLDPYELSLIATFIPPALRPNAPIEVAESLAPFVELKTGTFTVDHDSLLQKLNGIAKIRKECLVAASAVAKYFRSFLESSDFTQYSEYEVLFALLWLSHPLNDGDLVDLAVSRLANRTRASGRPASLLKLVYEFAKNGDSHVMHKRTVRRLIHIIYDACWIEGAIELACAYRDESPEIRLCYSQALSSAGRHDEAEEELQAVRATIGAADFPPDERSRIEAYVGLTSALVARVRGDYDMARSRYTALKPGDFLTQEDKCVFYRFGEVVGAVDAAERLTLALEIARRLSDPIHFVRSAVSLAMVKAERGFTDQALALLNEADSRRVASYVDAYMSANNRLVVELLMGTPSQASYEALHESLPLVIESMDRILIMNNLMAAAVGLGDIGGATRFAQILEEALGKIVEPNMRRLSFYNCSRFYALQGSPELAQDYFMHAFEAPLGFDEAYWLARQSCKSDPAIDFRLIREFDLPMMSNWYFSWPGFVATTE